MNNLLVVRACDARCDAYSLPAQLQAAPAESSRVQKKKLWEAVQPLLKTDGEATARFREAVMLTSAGPVRATSLKNANVA